MRRGAVLWMAVGILCMAGTALAVHYTWIGGYAGDWEEPDNWEPDVPVENGFPCNGADDATIDTVDASNDVVITMQGNNCLDDLTIYPATAETTEITGGAYTLDCDVLTVAGPKSGTGTYNVFRASGGVLISTTAVCD